MNTKWISKKLNEWVNEWMTEWEKENYYSKLNNKILIINN